MRRLNKASTILQRRGWSYPLYLIYGYLIPKWRYRLLHEWSRSRLRRLVLLGGLSGVLFVFLALVWFFNWQTALLITGLLSAVAYSVKLAWPQIKIVRLRRQARALLHAARTGYTDNTFTSWINWPVSVQTRRAVDAAGPRLADKDFVIGHIDNDGRVWGPYGELPGVPNINEAEFVSRYRFPLDIVLRDDMVLIRKDFRGNQARFVQEWVNLVTLHGQANVPAVYRADETKTLLYKNLINGRTLRDVLVAAGAKILTVQTESDPTLVPLDYTTRLNRVLARGTERLGECFSEAFISKLEQEMERIHAQGIAQLSLTFGNIMVDHNETPWFIDLEGAQRYGSTSSPAFNFRRDQDRRKFNQIYGGSLLTEKSVRTALTSQANKLPGWYAPIDFGQGLTVGGFWSVDSGTGRWEFLNRQVMVPLVAGKRVLDLGCNNGVMPMMMLRSGADEVVGIELDPAFVESARLVHQIFEWRDVTSYPFQIHQGNMLDILNGNWGNFDVITALCTLYYLSAEDMARVVRKAATIAPTMIVQVNSGTRSQAADEKAEKSSLSFLKRLLEQNGFPNVETVAPENYERPVLIGHTKYCDMAT